MGIGRRTLVVLGFVVISLFPAGVVFAQLSVVTPPPISSYPQLDANACVQKPQHVLILDMKSGWWQGDGGEFHNMLLPRIVRDCVLIDVEYYYLQFFEGPAVPGLQQGVVGLLSFYPLRPSHENGGIMVAANFPSRPWGEYTQVWMLSGSDLDNTDIQTTDPFFLNLLSKYASLPATPLQPWPNFFIGAGLSHHDHANRVLATFQVPELFQTHTITPSRLHKQDADLVIESRLRVGGQLVAHALFEGADNIADRVDFAVSESESDFLLTANNPFQVIGQNTEGEPAIAVRETEARRIVLDTGVFRFYSLALTNETATYRYLHNIIKYLAP